MKSPFDDILGHLCCTGLSALVLNAGKSGLGVVFQKTNSGGMFLLQARAVESSKHLTQLSEQQRLVASELFGGSTLNLLTTIGIRFCPSCGTQLLGLALEHAAWFESLACAHAEIDTGLPSSVVPNNV